MRGRLDEKADPVQPCAWIYVQAVGVFGISNVVDRSDRFRLQVGRMNTTKYLVLIQ